ncbi:MAG: asparagine synthase (glutamine-hydrolyzing) [bacterium]
MCGITGYFGQNNQDALRKMTDSLKHRGPDDKGFYFDDKIGLGFRRLSIIDLNTGNQPMSNEDNNVWLVFNGEIYNFRELREDLIKKGHKFNTKSDTETIIHLYEEKGEDFLKELNGMFALAIWDSRKKKLILARDRMGQKPLYYCLNNDTLIFGSELKALFEHPLIEKEIDFNSLNKYLIYEYVPTPHTIIKGINKLEPGHFLVYQNNQLKNYVYWDIEFKKSLNTGDYLAQFEFLLDESVKKRLMADVPLGIFLSGGIDSSTIAYFAQKNSSQKIKTFSIGFSDKSFDETTYAHQVADFLGTEHFHQNFTPFDCLNSIDKIANINDEPLADASIVPTYLLSKFTRDKVKVALSGDGGDELLAGYPTFQALKIAKILKKAPKSFIKIAQIVANYLLPVSFNNFSFDFKVKKTLSGYDWPVEIQNQIWLGSFTPQESQNMFRADIARQIDFNQSFSNINELVKKTKNSCLENRLIYLYLKQYLSDDVLAKADRASMFASLEVRAPFLDYKLIEFVNSLPYCLKLNGFQTKYALKKVMKGKLPDNIINRPKKGFGIPVAKWLTKELKSFTLDLLSRDAIEKQGIFNYSEVKRLLNEHLSKKVDHRKKLWTLLMFQQWYNNWK